MIEGAAGGPAPDPEDGQAATTPGDSGVPVADVSGVPAAVTEVEVAPEWLDAATELLGRDPDTGLVDTDRLLEAIGWLSRAVFSHAKTDRSHHTKATLLEQIQSTQAVMNSMHAVQHVRVAQYAATAESQDPDFGLGVSPGWSPDPDPDADETLADAPFAEEASREHAHPLGHVCEFTDVDLAPAMCWGPFQAVRHINDAVDAVAKTPRLVDEMGAGRLDAARVAQVTGELIEAGDHTCAHVQDRLLDQGIGGWTSRQAKNRAHTLVRRLDPAAAKRARTTTVKDEIGSFTRPRPGTGLTEWDLVLPTQQALPAIQAVEDLARQLHQDTTGDKTLGQCRIDALCDLLLGRAEVSTTITVLVPVRTTTNPGSTPSDGSSDGAWQAPVPDSLVEDMMTDYNWDGALHHLIVDLQHADRDHADHPADPHRPGDTGDHDPPGTTDSADPPPDDPPLDGPVLDPRGRLCLPDVEVPGLGVIPAGAVQDLIRTLGTRLTRSLVDWRTGTLLETGTGSYRPTDRVRRHVLQRDLHCRFPGCGRPARFCDVDHVTPWPHGPTQVANLQALCRHHHRAKHETRWEVTMTPDGICTWTSPTGRTYTTHPGSLEVTADLHITPGPAETPPASDEVDVPETAIGIDHTNAT